MWLCVGQFDEMNAIFLALLPLPSEDDEQLQKPGKHPWSKDEASRCTLPPAKSAIQASRYFCGH